MGYLYEACDEISDFCHQYLLRKMRLKSSMCIKINKVGKQEVGIWWVQKHLSRYGVPIWSLWPNIRSLLSIVAEKNVHICTMWYMPIFSRIFLINYWWQKSDIWSQASYRYPISWEAFFDPSDSYFLFAEERGYQKWALAHSSSCFLLVDF
jgi:hypothetical protein